MHILLIFAFCLIVLEAFTQAYVRWARKHFQWLITEADEKPKLDPKGLSKFFINGFDPQLGWIRKPNTGSNESGKYGATKYQIDSRGSRSNIAHEHLPIKAICYGDSFTFCRQVNDDETWPWHLSGFLNGNVVNFGVGNYGLDQSILRFERESTKVNAPITIMGVVPSTIVRILSYWKHYNEYGNTFAFKPRYDLSAGQLVLYPNLINTEEKFFSYEQFLPEIQKKDFFYLSKFKREQIRFPYLFHTVKNPTRNLAILGAMTLAKILGAGASQRLKDYPLQKIMRINLDLRIDLFSDSHALDLLCALVREFKRKALSLKTRPIFLLMPQKDDILFIKSNYNYYASAMSEIAKEVDLIDLTSRLLESPDLDLLYSDDGVYGGHLSNSGNALAARTIYETLESLGVNYGQQ